MLRTRIKELSEPKKCLARGRQIEDEMRSLPQKKVLDARAVHMYAYSPLSYNARIELATQSVRAFLSGLTAASKARPKHVSDVYRIAQTDRRLVHQSLS